jgi:hypothetical protein
MEDATINVRLIPSKAIRSDRNGYPIAVLASGRELWKSAKNGLVTIAPQDRAAARAGAEVCVMRATDAERSEIEAALSGKGHSLASLEAINVAADQAADEIQES